MFPSKLSGLAGHRPNTGHLLNPGSNRFGHEVPTAATGKKQGSGTPFILSIQPCPDDFVHGRMPPNVLTKHAMTVKGHQRCRMNSARDLKHGLLCFHVTEDGLQLNRIEWRLTREPVTGWR